MQYNRFHSFSQDSEFKNLQKNQISIKKAPLKRAVTHIQRGLSHSGGPKSLLKFQIVDHHGFQTPGFAMAYTSPLMI